MSQFFVFESINYLSGILRILICIFLAGLAHKFENFKVNIDLRLCTKTKSFTNAIILKNAFSSELLFYAKKIICYLLNHKIKVDIYQIRKNKKLFIKKNKSLQDALSNNKEVN